MSGEPGDRVHDWAQLVALSGEAGRAWLAEYERPEHAAIAGGTDRALALLRRRQNEPAAALLEEARARLEALVLREPGAPPSIVHVLERWYHGVSAYYFYCVDDPAPAERGLFLADRAVRRAVEQERFLLPLAHHCHEFVLHLARIARNGRRWRAMHEHLTAVRAMIDNRAPLCELGDGTKVDYAMIARHCAAFLPSDEEGQRTLQSFADASLRQRGLDRFVLQLYLLPGFVLPQAAT